MDVTTTLFFTVAHLSQLVVLWFLIEQLHGAIKRIRRLERVTEHLVNLDERVEELERTAMRKGWPYVEDVISVDERSFYQPQYGEEGRG